MKKQKKSIIGTIVKNTKIQITNKDLNKIKGGVGAGDPPPFGN